MLEEAKKIEDNEHARKQSQQALQEDDEDDDVDWSKTSSLEKEKRETRKLVQHMKESPNLSNVTKVLSNFEGKLCSYF